MKGIMMAFTAQISGEQFHQRPRNRELDSPTPQEKDIDRGRLHGVHPGRQLIIRTGDSWKGTRKRVGKTAAQPTATGGKPLFLANDNEQRYPICSIFP
jgi:hypothetical protein